MQQINFFDPLPSQRKYTDAILELCQARLSENLKAIIGIKMLAMKVSMIAKLVICKKQELSLFSHSLAHYHHLTYILHLLAIQPQILSEIWHYYGKSFKYINFYSHCNNYLVKGCKYQKTIDRKNLG